MDETAKFIISNADDGIKGALQVLLEAGVFTTESCQGGDGHSYPEPTVEFHGNSTEGFRAYAVAVTHGLRVFKLRRTYSVVDGELTGPQWEMVFRQEPDQR